MTIPFYVQFCSGSLEQFRILISTKSCSLDSRVTLLNSPGIEQSVVPAVDFNNISGSFPSNFTMENLQLL